MDIGKQIAKQIPHLSFYFQNQAKRSLVYHALMDVNNLAPLQREEQELFSYQEINEEKVRIWTEKPLYGRHLSKIKHDHLYVSVNQEPVLPNNYMKIIIRAPSKKEYRIQHQPGGCQALIAT